MLLRCNVFLMSVALIPPTYLLIPNRCTVNPALSTMPYYFTNLMFGGFHLLNEFLGVSFPEFVNSLFLRMVIHICLV